MRKELEITITPEGEVKILTHGFKGEECLEAVKPFEGTVGVVNQRELTSEYYEQPRVVPTQRTRGR